MFLIKQTYIRLLLFIVFQVVIVNLSFLSAQSKIDSLQKVLKNAKEKDKPAILNSLADLYLEDKKDIELTAKTIERSLSLCKKYKNYEQELKANNVLGSMYFVQNNYDKSLELYLKAEKIGVDHNIENIDFLKSINEISIMYYYKQDFDKMLEYSKKTEKVADDLKDLRKKAEAINRFGLYWYYQGNLDKTLDFWQKELEIRKELNDKKDMATAYNNIGVIYKIKGDYQKAIEFYQQNLDIQKQLDDTTNIARSLSNIGSVYYTFGVDFKKALDYYEQALELFRLKKDTASIASAMVNVGMAYLEIKEKEKALEYLKEVLKITKDKFNISVAKKNIGVVYIQQDKYEQALIYLLDALNLFEELGDKKEVSLTQLSIGECYYKLKNNPEALKYLEMSLNMMKEIGLKKEISDAYKNLSLVYQSMDKPEKALDYYRMYSERKDSSLKEDYQKTMVEMDKKFESAKKEAEIIKQKASIKQQQFVIWGFAIGFILIILFSILLFKQYHEKKKANVLLEKQNDEISKQRDQIFHQKQEITDSIHYASRIQRAILPPKEAFAEIMPEHFILWKPRDIVSGDYYWMTTKANKTIFTAADCTGHGVPGAFMSMLGTAFLTEIVNKHEPEELTSNHILDELRRHVVSSLHQTGKVGESQDGMDIALCVIDHNTKSMQFSGAHNPLIMVRGDTLEEFKPDKMPIGIYKDKNDNFSRHDINYQSGDQFYIFTDGYVDQFGGERKKKFMKTQLKDLLLKIRDKTMDEQEVILRETIENWMKDVDQIDDILLIGVKIT